MTPPPKPPKPLPVVYRQRWILVLADGSTYDAGYSYHLDLEDHGVFLGKHLAAKERAIAGGVATGGEEPLGAAELFHTTAEHMALIRASGHGLRSR